MLYCFCVTSLCIVTKLYRQRMVAAVCRTLLAACRTPQHHSAEDHKLNRHYCGNLKYKIWISLTPAECIHYFLFSKASISLLTIDVANCKCYSLCLWYINPLTPNDAHRGRTAPLTSKLCILYIYSTNIGTEYFKHGIYSPFFLFKCSLFHNSNVFGSCIIHILYTGCAKI